VPPSVPDSGLKQFAIQLYHTQAHYGKMNSPTGGAGLKQQQSDEDKHRINKGFECKSGFQVERAFRLNWGWIFF